MISGFLKIIDKISDRLGKVVSFFIITIALIIGYEVVSRYIFNSPTLWAHETSLMFFAAFATLGGAYALLNRSHVNMDLIYGRLSVRTKAILDVITFFLFAFFCGVLIWTSGKTALKSLLMLEHASTNWEPPIYPFKLLLPVGTFFLLLQGIAKFIRDINILRKGEQV
ncbi:TRAP transporter small permease subunit [Chloroflexota bacterium]